MFQCTQFLKYNHGRDGTQSGRRLYTPLASKGFAVALVGEHVPYFFAKEFFMVFVSGSANLKTDLIYEH